MGDNYDVALKLLLKENDSVFHTKSHTRKKENNLPESSDDGRIADQTHKNKENMS